MQRILKIVMPAAICTLLNSESLFAQQITRGPYLQNGLSTGIVVKWRTDVPTNSQVKFGLSPTALTGVVDDTAMTHEHEIKLNGLNPDTEYFYSVGTTNAVLAGGELSYFFVTSPLSGTPKPTRIWILGDSGTKNNDARAVRDAYTNFTGSRHTDLWLMLGDNAYNDGTDSEYQAAVFDMYPEMLRKSVLWPTRGNHDRVSSDGEDYYKIFTLPTAGDAGGLPSGTEAYYSFDYGNIHFICLESTSSALRATTSPMWGWLEADLASNDQDWTIAFWHHPPYSKGSHNSDSESELIQMRERALPLLEAAGVDLVMCGHSHSYERSVLLRGHYGKSPTLADSMKVDAGDGRADGDGAYSADDGTAYIVSGSSGKTSGGSLNHPVMFVSFNQLGSVVVDIAGSQLDARFLDSNGSVLDYFTMTKAISPAAELVILSGNEQSSFIGSTLPLPLVVAVHDSAGNPVADVAITFEVVSGEGSLSTTEPQLTDTLGRAEVTLTLGDTPGTIEVQASAQGVAPVTFTATAMLLQEPDIQITVAQIDFGSVARGDTISKLFTIKNVGGLELEIQNVLLLSGDIVDFKLDAFRLPDTLATGDSLAISMSFIPITGGIKHALLRIVHSDPDENPLDVRLTGIATSTVTVSPIVATTSTPATADDPAIWIHPNDPAKSVIIGTDKSAGVFVWDMNGNELQAIPQGTSVNNVDVRQNVIFGELRLDIVVANLRDAGKLAVFKVNPNYTGSDVLIQIAGKDSLNNDIQIDSYGLALYKRKTDGALFVFERPKTGVEVLRQYRLDIDSTGTRATLTPVRDLNYNGGVAEGMVADDELGYLYVSEENFGVHKYFADPNLSNDAIAAFALDDGIEGNREGVAIYACSDSAGYLILSSQGNSTYKIYERQGSNRFLKTIMPFDDVGETTLHTDGLDVTSTAVLNFPQGFLVVHDESGDHFLLYDWAQVAENDLTICVNGVHLLPTISIAPTIHDFGAVAVDSFASKIFEVVNSGTAQLTVDEIFLLGEHASEFALDSVVLPFGLAPGDTRNVMVRFKPTSAGSKNATLRFVSSDAEHNPLDVLLTGSAVTTLPQISVSRLLVNFGSVKIDSSAARLFFVANLGAADLSVSAVVLASGDVSEFTISSPAVPFVIAPQDSQALEVGFAPQSEGDKTAVLRIESNDAAHNPIEVNLAGKGVKKPVSVPSPGVIPEKVALKPNYPNPFNAETTIEYDLPEAGRVRLVIYNLLGQSVRVLADRIETPGFKKVRWDGKDQSGRSLDSGIYVIQLQFGNRQLLAKMTLLK